MQMDNWQVINFLIFNLLLSKWKAIIMAAYALHRMLWNGSAHVHKMGVCVWVDARVCVSILLCLMVRVLCQSKKICHSMNSNKSRVCLCLVYCIYDISCCMRNDLWFDFGHTKCIFHTSAPSVRFHLKIYGRVFMVLKIIGRKTNWIRVCARERTRVCVYIYVHVYTFCAITYNIDNLHKCQSKAQLQWVWFVHNGAL